MDKLTMGIIEARRKLTAVRQLLEIARQQRDLIESELFLGCDYNTLGKNETERKARFDALKRADNKLADATASVVSLEWQKDSATDELSVAEDCRRAYENALKSAYLEKQFGVFVNPDSFNIMQ